MTDNVDTVAQSDNIEPVTDSVNPVSTGNVKSDNSTPSVEVKDGKMFVDGVRVYSRDDTSKIAANAKRDAEQRILSDLNVDSFDAVKSVVQTLQETTPTNEGESLNVNSLRDAVKKREATVDELTNQVTQLKTELLLKDHMGQLQNAMPSTWSAEQRDSVVTLMKAKGMLAIDGDTFAIRNGDDFLTTDGEAPDYSGAIELVGKKWLGLPFGKRGVEVQYGETGVSDSGNRNRPVDEQRLNTDADYRRAYTNLRRYNTSLTRAQITHNMVMKQAGK